MSPLRPSYAQGFAHSAAEAAEPHLWSGLRALYVPMLGRAGKTLLDWSGRGGDATPLPNTSWSMTEEGVGINTTNDGISLPGPLITDETSAFTIAMSFVFTVLASNDYLYDQQTSRMLIWNNTTAFKTYRLGTEVLSAVHGLSVGEPVHLVWTVTRTPDHQYIWCNGKELLDDNTAFVDWGAASGVAKIAERYEGDPKNLPGKITFFAFYDREWTVGEAQEFHQDPYRILRPTARVFTTGGAPPTVKPWWYYQRAAMRRAS